MRIESNSDSSAPGITNHTLGICAANKKTSIGARQITLSVPKRDRNSENDDPTTNSKTYLHKKRVTCRISRLVSSI